MSVRLSSLRMSHAGCSGLTRNLVMQLRPGLVLSAIEGTDTGGEDAIADMLPGISLSLMLTGSTEARCGRSNFTFGTAKGRATGTMMALEGAERAVRKRAAGMTIAYVGLTMTREWLEGGDEAAAQACRRFASRHLDQRQWQLSAQTAWLTRSLLDAPVEHGVIERLQAESRALELIANVFAQMEPEQTELSASALARVGRVRTLIEEAPETITKMDDLARYAGVNATTLQQQFRMVCGTTIFARIRSVRLDRAVAALRNGDTIANAAHLAGYSTPANFATAVRRHYGATPSQMRAHVLRPQISPLKPS